MGGSLKDDDSATDSEGLNGDLPDSTSAVFVEGEKVLAYHGPRIYEAKVQKAEIRKNEWRYFVHYLGWNKNWDEWVGKDRLMKYTEENVLKQQALDKKQGVDKNQKSARAGHTRPKVSTDTKLEKEDSRNTGTKGKKRKTDVEVEKEDDTQVGKPVKIQIPPTLKKQLVDDWESITQQDKLIKLPRSPNVDTILSKYMEYNSLNEGSNGMTTDQSQEIVNGVLCYFNKVLAVMLLYKKERQQYVEAVVGDVSPSAIYGAEHLLRLFVKLPDLLGKVKMEEETHICLKQKLNDILKFMQRNQSTFFLSTYDGSKVSEGFDKEEDN